MATIMEALGGSNGETIMEVLGGNKGETIAKVVEEKGIKPAAVTAGKTTTSTKSTEKAAATKVEE